MTYPEAMRRLGWFIAALAACGGGGAAGAGDAATDLADGADEERDGASDAPVQAPDAVPQHPLFLAWRASPATHPNIPDVSWAGYRYGEAPLPDGAGWSVIDPTAPPYGATPDDDVDDAPALQAALDAADGTGTIVALPAGTFRIATPLTIRRDQTLLRGAGRGATRLLITRTLADALGPRENSAGQSEYSFTGGFVWVTPVPGLGASWRSTGAPIAVAPALRGARTLTLTEAPPSWLVPGATVLLRQRGEGDPATAERGTLSVHLSGDGDWARDFQADPDDENRNLSSTELLWPVEIDGVAGLTVTLHQPLRFDLRAVWAPELVQLQDVVVGSGVEHLTIETARTTVYPRFDGTVHNHEPGWNGVFFSNAIHGVARDLAILGTDGLALGMRSAKNVTVTGVAIDAPPAHPELAPQHHAFLTAQYSHDNLIEDFTIASIPMHGVNVEGHASGNVWSRGTMNGNFDSHKRLPFENVRTEITIHVDGVYGGSAQQGPLMGARFVHWNIVVTGGFVSGPPTFRGDEATGAGNMAYMIGAPSMMPLGAIVDVRGIDVPQVPYSGQAPRVDYDAIAPSGCVVDVGGTSALPPGNLFEAQRAARLGR